MNACADRGPPVAPQVPQAVKPCELPFQEKATELAAQTDLDKPLPGDDLSRLYGQDAAAYNALFPRFNANLDWAAEHCVARPPISPQ